MWYIFEKEIVQGPQKQCSQVKNKNLENLENLINLENLENQENQEKQRSYMCPLFFLWDLILQTLEWQTLHHIHSSKRRSLKWEPELSLWSAAPTKPTNHVWIHRLQTEAEAFFLISWVSGQWTAD